MWAMRGSADCEQTHTHKKKESADAARVRSVLEII